MADRRRIVVAGGEELFCECLALLAASRYELRCSAQDEDARELVTQWRPELLIADVRESGHSEPVAIAGLELATVEVFAALSDAPRLLLRRALKKVAADDVPGAVCVPQRDMAATLNAIVNALGERRRSPRAPLSLPLRLQTAARRIDVESSDLGTLGLSARVDDPFPANTAVEISILEQDQPQLTLAGRVLRLDKPVGIERPRMVIGYEVLEPATQQALGRLVRRGMLLEHLRRQSVANRTPLPQVSAATMAESETEIEDLVLERIRTGAFGRPGTSSKLQASSQRVKTTFPARMTPPPPRWPTPTPPPVAPARTESAPPAEALATPPRTLSRPDVLARKSASWGPPKESHEKRQEGASAAVIAGAAAREERSARPPAVVTRPDMPSLAARALSSSIAGSPDARPVASTKAVVAAAPLAAAPVAAAAGAAPHGGSRKASTQIVDGRYRVTARLGESWGRQLLRARQEILHREVLLVGLPGKLAGDSPELERFNSLARTCGAVHHPGLVAVLDTARDGSGQYVVFDIAEGETLRERILADKRVPIPFALGVVRLLCGALSAWHALGLVHGAVKPENILLDDVNHGVARLGNFGMCTNADDPAARIYAAPEQLEGGEVDPRADVFAVGLVFAEMLTGLAPKAGPGGDPKSEGRAVGRADFVAKLESQMPRAAWEIVSRATQPLATDRFVSINALSRTLDDVGTVTPGGDSAENDAVTLIDQNALTMAPLLEADRPTLPPDHGDHTARQPMPEAVALGFGVPELDPRHDEPTGRPDLQQDTDPPTAAQRAPGPPISSRMISIAAVALLVLLLVGAVWLLVDRGPTPISATSESLDGGNAAGDSSIAVPPGKGR